MEGLKRVCNDHRKNLASFSRSHAPMFHCSLFIPGIP
jgi:hypothetical protein